MADVIERTLKNIFSSLNRIKGLITNPDRLTSVEIIDVRLQRLDILWKEFKSLEMTINTEDLNLDLKSAEFEDELFEAGLMKVKNERFPARPLQQSSDNTVAPLLNELFEQQCTFFGNLNETTFNIAGRMEIKDGIQFPKLMIEKFDEVYRNWPAFEDAYVSSIHNNSALSNVTKFKLLKRLLSDGPAALIRNILETEANYEQAWNKLLLRYRKRKHILMSYITAFIDQLAALNGRPNALRSLSDKSDELLIGIRTMGVEAEYRDAWLIQIPLRKLDSETRQEWIKETVSEDFPSITKFLEFLNFRCDGMVESLAETKHQQPFRPQKLPIRSMHLTTNALACLYCKKPGHLVHRCMKIRFLNGSQRRSAVSQLSLCENCLQSGHTVSSCSSSFTCRYCNQIHHSLLHVFNSLGQPSSDHQGVAVPHKNVYTPSSQVTSEPKSSTLKTSQPSSPASSSTFHSLPSISKLNRTKDNHHPMHSTAYNTQNQKSCLTAIHISNSTFANDHLIASPRTVILPTALVHVRDRAANLTFAYALLDSGSQCSFVSEQLVQRLGLTRAHSSSSVSGLSNKKAAMTKGIVSIEVSSRFSHINRLSINAYILPRVVTLASAETEFPTSDIIKSLKLADPHAGSSREIDILLGADVFFDIICPDKIITDGRTHAQSTMFVWVIIAPPRKDVSATQGFSTIIEEDDINQTLQQFWEIEEVPDCKAYLQSIDKCEMLFQSTICREDNGRYMVNLPFKSPRIALGHSKTAAVRRLLSMERRFEKNASLALAYKEFMEEYLRLGHMEMVSDTDPPKPNHEVFYLPHHAVYKPDSSTTKLRVVFDGSCKTTTGWSLNDALLTGPTIQNDLVTIILRFRKFATVFSADLEKIYRQIRITPPDDDFQRIVWRNRNDEEIKAYRLKTVTYGTSCAPFLAVRTLHQIATDIKTTNPDIVEVITRDFYIDDLLSGCDDDDTAIVRVNKITSMLENAGIHLRKWKSNSGRLLETIPKDMRDPTVLNFSDKSSTSKTLGIHWNPVLDVFKFSIDVSSTATIRRLINCNY